MPRLLLTALFSLTACGALGSRPPGDGGAPNAGRDGSVVAGGGGGTGTGGGQGGGLGGGGGSLEPFDSGWPMTRLPSDAFVETLRPGLYGYLEPLPMVVWRDRVFVAPGRARLVEYLNGNWQVINSAVDYGIIALRAWPEGIVVMASHQLVCGGECLDGGALLNHIDIQAALNVVCRGDGPLTIENSYGQFGAYVDGGWHARTQPFEHFIGPGGPCWSVADGTILYGGSRIVHIGLDGGSRFETPKSDAESFTDFVKTRFGFVAIGAAQRVFIAADGGWQLVAERGQGVTPDVWFRAVPLPDGRFLAIGVNGLSVVGEGTIASWPYPRGQLQTNTEAIDVTSDGTVWIAGRFQPPGNADPEDVVVGYRLR